MTVYMLRRGGHVTLRAATNADGAAVATLIHEVLAEYGLKGEPDATDACVADIQKNYVAGGGLFNVLEDADGKLVGCYGLYPHGSRDDHRTCELRKMYFRQTLRGQGVGKQIMQRALTEAKAHGFKRVELDTASVLKEAVALYESFGFKPFENPHMPKRCDVAMALDL